MSFEVAKPILNSPFEAPHQYWYIREGETPQQIDGRRPAMVFQPRETREDWPANDGILRKLPHYERGYELLLVNVVRDAVAQWRSEGYPGATRTTLDLLAHWRRDGRKTRLFFAQLEAAETIIFLREARSDFLQGVDVPRESVSEDVQQRGYAGFVRYACKMATGSGKSTVMGMLAAWSILNKVNDRGDARFSDVVLIVCPNVTIRDRLRELDPESGEASLYRTRDLVPAHLMPLLTRGRVLVTNWHVLQPQTPQASGGSSRVVRAGVRVEREETIIIGEKTTTARGSRYMTSAAFGALTASGSVEVLAEPELHPDGSIKKVRIRSAKYEESDAALVKRVLGRSVGGKQNILVMNDEAHHAYRIEQEEDDEDALDEFSDDDEAEDFFKEATVWVEGLDKVNKERGINFCLDLSATPYYLGRVRRQAGRPFPWVVSDFGLIDAIESGLVKIPQLALSDTTGAERAKYFNIWKWIIEEQLTAAEKGGKRGSPRPEAILKHSQVPIAMMGGSYEDTLEEWSKASDDPRPPVFILVCKNTKIAATVYEWIAEGKSSSGIPESKLESLRNRDGRSYTIRVDSKVVAETDTEGAKDDEKRWMRFTLDTVGKSSWPADSQGRWILPDGFEELAQKLNRPFFPPGRDIRCIVSVGMLTEGWDANTVTHIIGLRPFMSQLLCEQVVGRGLRRASYELGDDGLFKEEIAQVLGVPFEVIPFKASTGSAAVQPAKRFHVHALPERAELELRYPRVEGYTQAIRGRVRVDWDSVPKLTLDPLRIPPAVTTRGVLLNSEGRPSLSGPGAVSEMTLAPYRAGRRTQELVFDLARDLTRTYLESAETKLPAHVLFPQLRVIVDRYLREKVEAHAPFEKIDALFLSPYYGHVLERLLQAIRPDTESGEAPEIPVYERLRESGSTAVVDWWTSKDVRPTRKSHLNYMVADTNQWEQSASFYIDGHSNVRAWVKNAGLGFAIPYLHDGQMHDYIPDFIIEFEGFPNEFLILELKGHDPLVEVKKAAAERWVRAVNAEGSYGKWRYGIAWKPADVSYFLVESGQV
ncbi:MAG: BPTD_3080 family restriction endonuclease [Gemmatimonadota bacterium]